MPVEDYTDKYGIVSEFWAERERWRARQGKGDPYREAQERDWRWQEAEEDTRERARRNQLDIGSKQL